MPAQQYQVVYGRFTAIRPMLDVMRIDKVAVGAAGKAATAIAPLQGAANGRRNGAAFTPDVQGLTIFFIQPLRPTCIAGDAPRGFRSNGASVFYFGLAIEPVGSERFHVSVHMHREAISAAGAFVTE